MFYKQWVLTYNDIILKLGKSGETGYIIRTQLIDLTTGLPRVPSNGFHRYPFSSEVGSSILY